MALADFADDNGDCWPSIPTLCEWTCFSERAVHGAIRWLEEQSVVVANRGNGRHTRYSVTPDGYQPPQELRPRRSCATAAGAENPRSSCGAPPQEMQSPPQQVRSNHQEPSRTQEASPKKRAGAPALDEAVTALLADVDPAVLRDWLALRKAKRAPVTETVVRHAVGEAEKAGLPLTAFLRVWCARGSQGLEAAWLKPHERGQSPPGRPSAAASFHGKTYRGDTDDQLPDFLRPKTGTHA